MNPEFKNYAIHRLSVEIIFSNAEVRSLSDEELERRFIYYFLRRKPLTIAIKKTSMIDYMITIKNSFMDIERIFCISADNEEEAEIMGRTTIAVDEYLYEVLDLGVSEC